MRAGIERKLYDLPSVDLTEADSWDAQVAWTCRTGTHRARR